MPEQVNDGSQQREVASTTNWEALEDAFSDEVIAEQIKAETKPENTEENKGPESEEIKPEETTDKKEETTEEEKKEEKTETTEEKAPEEVVLKTEDVEGFETEPEDGTWLAVAKARGLSVEADTFEAYVAAEDAKKQAEIEAVRAEVEQVKALTKEEIFSTLKPEVAAALRLIESGWEQEKVFEPTKEIDAFLALEDIELLRKDLELQKWTPDQIDMELTILSEKDGRVKHEADKLRAILNRNKEEVIAERESVLSKYSQLQEAAVAQKRDQEVATVREGIKNIPAFMNAKIDEGAKEAVISKYLKGEYDSYINDPKSKIDLILFKEFSEKAIKHLERTSFEKGRETVTKKLSNIPPVQGQTANRVVENNQINQWDALNELL